MAEDRSGNRRATRYDSYPLVDPLNLEGVEANRQDAVRVVS
jgi:hypothetical protein